MGAHFSVEETEFFPSFEENKTKIFYFISLLKHLRS